MSNVKQTGKKRGKVGDGTPGPGRPKGSQNKATAFFKDAVMDTFKELGGVPAMVTWAKRNKTAFYTKILPRIAPHEIRAQLNGDGSGGPVTVLIRDMTGRKDEE